MKTTVLNCRKSTLPISRSSARAGITGRQYWIITGGSSWPAGDVADTVDDALCLTGVGRVKVRHKPRLLSDNDPCYIFGELSDYLQANGMTHTRGRPYHPQTQVRSSAGTVR